jgi:hypothetical protein
MLILNCMPLGFLSSLTFNFLLKPKQPMLDWVYISIYLYRWMCMASTHSKLISLLAVSESQLPNQYQYCHDISHILIQVGSGYRKLRESSCTLLSNLFGGYHPNTRMVLSWYESSCTVPYFSNSLGKKIIGV